MDTGDPDPDNPDSGILDFLSPLWDWLTRIVDGLSSIAQSILNLPGLIVEGIKSLFIPDQTTIQADVTRLADNFKAATGVSVVDFGSVFGQEQKAGPGDVDGTIYIYGVGDISATFADFSFVSQAVDFFRPYIRGFFVLLLAFYNVNQFLAFIRAGSVSNGSGSPDQ